jgi:hypothetical protein
MDTSVLSIFELGILNRDAIRANVFEPFSPEFVNLIEKMTKAYGSDNPGPAADAIRSWMIEISDE